MQARYSTSEIMSDRDIISEVMAHMFVLPCSHPDHALTLTFQGGWLRYHDHFPFVLPLGDERRPNTVAKLQAERCSTLR
ncbi:hypothetical protein FIBSPDRAFT_187347 [Athelia psychrophila]|uniref:Uncharacterized protein n=1 Tax=Athelia psychrophila TaxID=1759441 RepID=A0A166A7V1_9AGAM|nr:hypothetical protein FIBSPDRAFT_187347 [Fibularhizoctonia sp. CBS 109695]